MKWNKFRLKTTTEAEDIVSSMLADLGVEGVEIEDKIPLTESDKEQMFVDILPEIEADDGVAYLSFYLEEDEDKEKVLANVKKELEEMSAYVNVGACEIEESQTEDVDWVNNWKKYFHQFYVDDILIIPSWEDVKPSDEDKMVIHIDPGTAFGTGMHETTQLVIRQLKKFVTKDTQMLDVGTGSGCIAVSLSLEGYKDVVAWDISDDALAIARTNNEVLGANVLFEKKDVFADQSIGSAKFDIIVSNPPYVTEAEREEMELNVLDWEPELALFVSDNDPLCFYRCIAILGRELLTGEGQLYFEINRAYGVETVSMLTDLGYRNPRIIKDISGNDRIVTAYK